MKLLRLILKKPKKTSSEPHVRVVTCNLTGRLCIYADAQPDTGIYENCRLCEEWMRRVGKI